MNKVKTLDDLRKMRESLRASLDLREKSNNPEQMVQIKVAMATCGIAAGAKEVMSYFIEALRPGTCRCPGHSNRVYGLLLCRTDSGDYCSRQRTDRIWSCQQSQS